jgi:hypothetical protein
LLEIIERGLGGRLVAASGAKAKAEAEVSLSQVKHFTSLILSIMLDSWRLHLQHTPIKHVGAVLQLLH